MEILKNRLYNLTYENSSKKDYMSISTDLVGLEDKFVILNSNQLTNVYVLPIFSNIISLKVYFYIFGVQYNETLGLSNEDVKTLLDYASETFNNAIQYITDKRLI